jgi:hydroxymethylglutaryl-CoA lyase
VDEIAIFAAASETFSRKNINQTIDESLATYKQVCDKARSERLRVRGYLSTCFGCPFEGHVPPARVADVAARLFDLGVYEVAVSDTIGVAHPGQVPEVVGEVTRRIPVGQVALHFHDTRGTALVNVFAGLQMGVTTFDASAGGLGGCPYAPGAQGNLATEDLLYMLDGLGIETGVRLEGVMEASRTIEPLVGHRLPSRVLHAPKVPGFLGS